MMDEIFFAPRMVRLATEKGFDSEGAAVNLAAFHAEVNIRSAGIAGDNIEFRPDGLVQQTSGNMNRVR